jgi:hypothetical protein
VCHGGSWLRPIKPVLFALAAMMLGAGCLSCGAPAISSSKPLPSQGGAGLAVQNFSVALGG